MHKMRHQHKTTKYKGTTDSWKAMNITVGLIYIKNNKTPKDLRPPSLKHWNKKIQTWESN